MKITTNTVVTMDFIVTDEKGQVLDTTNGEEPMSVLIGHSGVVPGLEDELLGHEEGERVEAVVTPDRAYGEHHKELEQTIEKSLFEGMEFNVGDTFLADTDFGKKPIVVKEILEDSVLVDGNHPLAGMTLKFMVDIVSVRQATDSEIEHGHVHGSNDSCGCDHDHGDEHGCCGHHHHEEDHECCGKHKHEEDHECCGKHKHEEDHECCGKHKHEEDHECCGKHKHEEDHECCGKHKHD